MQPWVEYSSWDHGHGKVILHAHLGRILSNNVVFLDRTNSDDESLLRVVGLEIDAKSAVERENQMNF